MGDDMISRVEAFLDNYEGCVDEAPIDENEYLTFGDLRELLALARNAIPAEPTPEMIAAGISALDDCVDDSWDSGPDGESHNSYTTIRSDAAAIVYRAMTKAALDRLSPNLEGSAGLVRKGGQR